MVILGLTGSIGMGKTTAAKYLRLLGVPVHDADAQVHALMAAGGAAVAAVEAAFPGVAPDGPRGGVDRAELAKRVFGDDAALKRLEMILHPLVFRAERLFLEKAAIGGAPLAVLDVPLLLETGGDQLCDGVVVVSAPPFVQRARVLRRPGMTEERFRAIQSRQMADADKRRMADFVVLTGLGRRFALQQLADIVTVAKGWRGRHWPPAGYRPRWSGRG